MLFNSLGFVVFLVVVLLFYYSPIKWKLKKIMLLLASYLFYALWNPPLILLLWISTMVDWIVGNKLYHEQDEKKRKWWLIISLVVNLGFLAYFKYGGFFLENFEYLVNHLGITYEALEWDILLPMGISFYTFQTMSYTIDMYLKRNEPAKRFLDFALYVTFFPQLVAGPIVRSKDLIPQFYTEKKATLSQFFWGGLLLTLGLFQKVVLADSMLSTAADQVYGSTKLLCAIDAWTGTLAFSGQIFFDFAGYSTCAIGIALMLGIKLPDNFRYPYAAIGFSDLWRRWHITLSTWLRDYLYIPLGGNKNGAIKTYRNLMITMLLGGLWHGAAWTFVIWGGLHGFYLMAERYLRKYVSFKINAWNGIALALLTYMLVNITWVFFRAQDFGSALNILNGMLGLNENGEMVLQYIEIYKVFIVISLLFLTHWFMRDSSVKKLAANIPWWLVSIVWAIMMFLVIISLGSGDQFIYFQF